jgi:Xaa-Pro aminopeptidase
MKKIWLIFCLFFWVFPVFFYGQRTELPKEEFMKRRAALMKQIKEGIIILFANAGAAAGSHFRQDNDFYYFTGIEDKNAILLLMPAAGEAVLFLPLQMEREVKVEGKNLLEEPKTKEKTGLTDLYPLSHFNEYLVRKGLKANFGRTFYVRLFAGDTVDSGRGETLLYRARQGRNPYNDQITLDHYRVKKLKERFPAFTMKDVGPFIDRLRVIKSPEEIKILRRNGKISAEAIKQAMRATRPGVYEYQLEAAAMHVVLKNGARGFAYPPIVGSGPNSCTLHYSKNSRKIEAGDVVLMDFAADLDHYCMDITRTWPASGRFTPEQREIYQAVLEVQKACIEAYRPGVTAGDVRKHAAEVMKKKKIDARGLEGGVHHYVGLSTHDVGPPDIPLEQGMVFTFEPGLYFPEKGFGVRIEDTILVTKDGCEVLSKDVPKEIAEIEALMKEK